MLIFADVCLSVSVPVRGYIRNKWKQVERVVPERATERERERMEGRGRKRKKKCVWEREEQEKKSERESEMEKYWGRASEPGGGWGLHGHGFEHNLSRK